MTDSENSSQYAIRKGIILYLADWFTPEKVDVEIGRAHV